MPSRFVPKRGPVAPLRKIPNSGLPLVPNAHPPSHHPALPQGTRPRNVDQLFLIRGCSKLKKKGTFENCTEVLRDCLLLSAKMKSHKRGAPSGIKVKVASETRVELNNLKEELGLPSVDSVIQRLLASFQLAEARFDAEPSPGGDRAERGKKRRVDVRKPLYSFELLAERRDMLEYYTGLDESAFRELLRRLQVSAVPGA